MNRNNMPIIAFLCYKEIIYYWNWYLGIIIAVQNSN